MRGVKGFLNNVKKTALFSRDGFPYSINTDAVVSNYRTQLERGRCIHKDWQVSKALYKFGPRQFFGGHRFLKKDRKSTLIEKKCDLTTSVICFDALDHPAVL